MLGERSTAKNYCPVSLLSVVTQVFEKFVNNRIVDHQEKCGLFSDFQYGFRFSWSTADLLTVVSDRITRAFNRSGATQVVALDISIAFDRVWNAGHLHKLKSYEISGQIFDLFSVLSNRWLWVFLDNIQLMLQFVKAKFSYYTLMTFLMMLCAILLSMLMILLSILCVIRHMICRSNFNWLQNLNLINENCGLGQEVACWFQWWENSTGFIWPI